MCRAFLSDLSDHGPLKLRESESCGRVINVDAIRVRTLKREDVFPFVLFPHCFLCRGSLSRAWTWASPFLYVLFDDYLD